MSDPAANKIFTNFKRVLFAAIGVILIAAASFWAFSIQKFIVRGETVQGKVVKLNYGGSHPEIKFTTAGGREIEYAQNGLIGGYSVGDQVPVIYDKENPENCEINSFGALWGFTVLQATAGLVFVGAAIFIKS